MDWNRFLDKNISQDENYDDVFDDDDNEALVTPIKRQAFSKT
jgi:hypothetical protein